MDLAAKQDIEDAVREALGLHGLGGRIVLEGTQVALHGQGTPVSIDVEYIGEQWPLLPPDLRKRKVAEIVRRLAEAHRQSNAPASAFAGAAAGGAKLIGPILGGALALTVVAVGVRFWLNSRPPPPAPVGVKTETRSEESSRLARICEAGRMRALSGASSVGPFEAGGWVVELWLASRFGLNLRENPILTGAVVGGKLSPSADEVLAQESDGTAAISAGATAGKGVYVTFGGGYARAFFDPDRRGRLLAVAERLTDGTKADLGALYGRCAHLTTHDIGAWFRGSDAPTAAAAMVYSMGLFATDPIVDRTGFGGTSELESILAASTKMDAGTLGGIVSSQGGTLTTAGSGVTLTFALGGPRRATTASRSAARKMGIGVGTD